MTRSPGHVLVAVLVRLLYRAVSAGHPGLVLAFCSPDVVTQTPGVNTLGGRRYSRSAYRAWFGRVRRLSTRIELRPDAIEVRGRPSDTRVLVYRRHSAVVADGTCFDGHGEQRIRLRWGRVVSVQDSWDIDAVERACAHLIGLGVAEALAPPITT